MNENNDDDGKNNKNDIIIINNVKKTFHNKHRKYNGHLSTHIHTSGKDFVILI